MCHVAAYHQRKIIFQFFALFVFANNSTVYVMVIISDTGTRSIGISR
jgi:hypothetical protein